MKSWMRAGSAALLVSLLFGCGTQPTSPGQNQITHETADDFALQAAMGMAVLATDVQLAVGSSQGTTSASARRGMPARAQWDTTFTVGGITIAAIRTFYDAQDTELAGYGPDAVRMHWSARAHGTYQGLRDTASVGHGAEIDVRGIESASRLLQLDGTCHDTLQSVIHPLGGQTRYFFWRSTTTIDAVRLLKPEIGTGGYAIDGSVTYQVSADRLRSNDRGDVERHYEITIVVTFNNTPRPTILVNGSFSYSWDMLTGQISRL